MSKIHFELWQDVEEDWREIQESQKFKGHTKTSILNYLISDYMNTDMWATIGITIAWQYHMVAKKIDTNEYELYLDDKYIGTIKNEHLALFGGSLIAIVEKGGEA